MLFHDGAGQFSIALVNHYVPVGTYTVTKIKNHLNTAWTVLNPGVTLTVYPPKPNSLSISPSTVTAGLNGQDTYTMTVGEGGLVNLDVKRKINNGTEQTFYNFVALDGTPPPPGDGDPTGHANITVSNCAAPGAYQYTGFKNDANGDDTCVSPGSPPTVTVDSSPAVTSFSPGSGPRGSAVTLTFSGRNLCSGLSLSAQTSGGASWQGITFSNVTADGASGSATMTIAADAWVGDMTIKVTASYGQTTIAFTVTNGAAPMISTISPASSTQGATGTITIAGSNLATATLARSGMTFTNYVYSPPDGSRLTASFTVASNAAASGQITVTNSIGSTSASFPIFAAGTVFWKKDYIQDESGLVVATAEVNPSQPTDTAPAAPTGLSGTGGLLQVTLNWTDNSTNETFFWLGRRRHSEPNYSLLTTLDAHTGTGGMSFADIGLPAGAYDYCVSAYRGAVQSASSCVANVTVSDGTDTTPPTAPTGLSAIAISSTRVQLQWNASTDNVGVHHYRIERYANTGTEQIDTPSNATTFTDEFASAGIAYRYRVRALDAAANVSDYSNKDLATTIVFEDDPLIARVTVIRAQHVLQLRQAVNAVRATAGLTAANWADASLAGVAVKATHIQELRDRLTEALTGTVFGFSAPSFMDPTLTPKITTIKTVHIEALRQYVK